MAGKVFLLRDNYRAQGNVHEWVARYCYDGLMNVVNKSRDLSLLDDWSREIFETPTRSHTLVINIENAEHARRGESRWNPYHADHIARLLPYIHKTFPRNYVREDLKVLVVTPYTAQRRTLADRVIALVK
jgi:hypothetical protein